MGAVITGLIGTCFVVLQRPAVGARLCASSASDHVSFLTNAFCDDRDRRVSEAEAQDYVDTLFASVNGSHREKAVRGQMVRGASSARDVTETWKPILRAERVTEAEREQGKTNVFVVGVRIFVLPAKAVDDPRFYAASLKVYKRDLTIRLEHSNDGIKASALTFDHNDPAGVVKPRPLIAQTRSDFYRGPIRAVDELAAVDPGSVVFEVCELQVSDTVDKWWGYTYLGWVPHSDLEIGDVPLPDVPICVYHPRAD